MKPSIGQLWSFVAAPRKSLNLGNSCSYTESIDVFSQLEDLVFIDSQLETERRMRTDERVGRQDQRRRDRVLQIRTETGDYYKDYYMDCWTLGKLYGHGIQYFPTVITVPATPLHLTFFLKGQATANKYLKG